jgi:drug/metabolite transporter (DMT)-like permease
MNSVTMKYCVLIICVMAISLGQILFKLSANAMKQSSSFIPILFDPVFIAAIALYGITTLGWVWCLQEVPLSHAYLFMSLAFVLVPLMGFFIFQEELGFRYILSASLIILGIMCSVIR